MFLVPTIAAADLTVGNDLLSKLVTTAGQPPPNLKTAQIPRRLLRLGLTGSAAAQDMKAQVIVGGQFAGELWNHKTGGPTDYMIDLAPVNIYIPANVELSIIVVDAGGTNIAYLPMHFE